MSTTKQATRKSTTRTTTTKKEHPVNTKSTSKPKSAKKSTTVRGNNALGMGLGAQYMASSASHRREMVTKYGREHLLRRVRYEVRNSEVGTEYHRDAVEALGSLYVTSKSTK